jgi:uncharacterized protein YggE
MPRIQSSVKAGSGLVLAAVVAQTAWSTFAGAAARAAQVQLQLSCTGTVLEAQGSATLKRAIDTLELSLTLEAEAPSAKAALLLLQERLDAVRTRLVSLEVKDLRVTSPRVWNRYVPAGKPAVFEAASQLSGQLAPAQLQALITQVGGLPGVRLAPVTPQADSKADATSNRQLLQAAYRDALQRGQDLAEAIGLRNLRPLQVQMAGGVRPLPMPVMAMARSAPAPFDPRELPQPSDRLSLEVTFCAIP